MALRRVVSSITVLVLIGLLVAALGCGDDDDDAKDSGDDTETDDDSASDDDSDDATDDDADDDTGYDHDTGPDSTPIIFVHGFLENGDAFAAQTQRFASNGYDPARIHAFDWDTLGGFDEAHEMLVDFVDWVLETDHAETVDLIGHSMGGSLCSDVIGSGALDGQVAHYVHAASFDFDATDWTVPVMTLSSDGDTLLGLSDVPGAQAVELHGLDHLQVATSVESFAALYKFFTGSEPATTDIVPETPIRLSGRVETIGFNTPRPAHTVRVYPFDPDTGARLSAEPAGTFVSDAYGFWGVFRAEPDTYYEFEVADPDGAWPVLRYYREPFTRSDNKVIFRVMPSPDTIWGIIDPLLPLLGSRATFAYLNRDQAVVAGRDTLTVGGYDLATEAIAPAEQTVLVAAMTDLNFNGATDGIILPGILGFMPFITVYDFYADADAGGAIPVVFNGRTMTIRADARPDEALSVAMFQK